jgi:hypothetical protein
VDEAKPFDIPKREVWEAFKKVKANQGAAGVDGQSIADFEADLSNSLYKLWSRLSSSPCRQPRAARRRCCPAAHRPSGGRTLISISTVHPKCSAKPLSRRRFLCAFNDLRIRTVEDQLWFLWRWSLIILMLRERLRSAKRDIG